jgi:DNA-binding transcriptional ArsR family regulator
MNLPLTEKQTIILTLIRKSWLDNGYSPTRKELSDGFEKLLGVKLTRQAVDHHLFPLIKKGYIIIDKKKGRRNIKIKI